MNWPGGSDRVDADYIFIEREVVEDMMSGPGKEKYETF